LIESVDKTSIPELFKWTKELGGYFKRFQGGALSPWVEELNPEEMDLEARATLAFFEVRYLSIVWAFSEFGQR
jgi:protein phosphatase PTC6